MSEKLEILEQQLDGLNQQKNSLMKEKKGLIENNPEVKRYVRLNFEEMRLEREIFNLKDKIKEETMLNCHHVFVNIDDKGNQYCIKCGLSTELTKSGVEECLKNRGIYEKTVDNSEIVNTDYACRKEVVMKICSYIVENILVFQMIS